MDKGKSIDASDSRNTINSKDTSNSREANNGDVKYILQIYKIKLHGRSGAMVEYPICKKSIKLIGFQ
jgi:hypothetical protein